MRTFLCSLALLPLLPACASGGDAKADDATDTGDPATPDSSSDSASDSATDSVADSSPPDDTDLPDDTGIEYLSSDDTVALGDCTSAAPICAAGVCTLDVDLTTVSVTGSFPFPHSNWGLRLADPRVAFSAANPLDGSGWGLDTPFGTFSIDPDSATYTIQAFAGVYDVALTYDTSRIFDERYFPVASGVTFDRDTAFDVALDLHAATGTLTVRGAPLTDFGWIRFEDPSTGGYALVSVTGGAWSVDLPDGVWDVTFGTYEPTTLADGTYALGTVTVSGADLVADLDIDAVPVSGSIAIDSYRFDVDELWPLSFVDADGSTFDVTLVGGQDWATYLPPGTYRAIASPWVVGEDLVVAGGETFALTDDSVTVTGTLSVDGTAATDGWTLRLEDPTLGIAYVVADASWSQSMHPGTYDVTALRSDGDSNVRARIAEGLIIATDTTLDLDLELARLTGPVQWNGGPGPHDAWRVLLVDGAGNTSIFLPHTDNRWWATVPVGTYDLYAEADHVQVDLHPTLARGRAVTGDEEIGLRVTTWPLTGTVRLDGVPALGWALYSHDEVTGDTMGDALSAAEPDWTIALPAGTYTFLGKFGPLTEAGTTHEGPLAFCMRIGG